MLPEERRAPENTAHLSQSQHTIVTSSQHHSIVTSSQHGILSQSIQTAFTGDVAEEERASCGVRVQHADADDERGSGASFRATAR